MTIEEFLAAFEELLESGEFEIYQQVSEEWKRFRLRKAENQDNPIFLCPITALCLAKCNEYYEVDSYLNAGLRLGLTSADIMAIASGADNLALAYFEPEEDYRVEVLPAESQILARWFKAKL